MPRTHSTGIPWHLILHVHVPHLPVQTGTLFLFSILFSSGAQRFWSYVVHNIPFLASLFWTTQLLFFSRPQNLYHYRYCWLSLSHRLAFISRIPLHPPLDTSYACYDATWSRCIILIIIRFNLIALFIPSQPIILAPRLSIWSSPLLITGGRVADVGLGMHITRLPSYFKFLVHARRAPTASFGASHIPSTLQNISLHRTFLPKQKYKATFTLCHIMPPCNWTIYPSFPFCLALPLFVAYCTRTTTIRTPFNTILSSPFHCSSASLEGYLQVTRKFLQVAVGKEMRCPDIKFELFVLRILTTHYH